MSFCISVYAYVDALTFFFMKWHVDAYDFCMLNGLRLIVNA